MRIDFLGRLSKLELRPAQALQPLLEAVVNAIQSVDEVKADDRPRRVDVEVLRHGQIEADYGDSHQGPVDGFRVIDTGVGFDDAHMDAFEQCDTRMKMHLGGKGVGRFTWLAAFRSAHVSSTFRQNGRTRQRSFDFMATAHGVENASVEDVASDLEITTSVLLDGYRAEYAQECPRRIRTIARRLLEHCLPYFVHGMTTSLELTDGDEGIDLNRLYAEEYKPHLARTAFDCNGQSFTLDHVRLYKSEQAKHRLHYCADSREVISEPIAHPDFEDRFVDQDGEPFVVSAFVSGSYLDEHVSQERDNFTFPEQQGMLRLPLVTRDEIRKAATSVLLSEFAPLLQPMQQRKVERVTEFAREHPQYRSVLKHSQDVLGRISVNATEAQMDDILHRAKSELDLRIRDGSERLLSLPEDQIDASEYEGFLDLISDIGKDELAQYVMRRKTILQHLKKKLERRSDGRHELEEAVHRLIFPLRATSDDVPLERQNLWLIDERLNYHSYLASDLPLRGVEPTDSTSRKEPDLIIFDGPIAFSEEESGYRSIVIIEFKRPSRNSFEKDKDPFSQVYDYIDDIVAGKLKDRRGRHMRAPDSTPFYCYVIADLTPNVERYAKNANLMKTPDGLGYFGFNQPRNAYTELIPYDKLLSDATRRNRIFFVCVRRTTYRRPDHERVRMSRRAARSSWSRGGRCSPPAAA